jgi:hypothetical protein
LKVGYTLSSKNELINVVNQWYIAHSISYQVQWSNSTYVQLQCKQAPKYKRYLRRGYKKRSDLFEIAKLKGSHTCISTLVQKDHYQLDANFIVSIIVIKLRPAWRIDLVAGLVWVKKDQNEQKSSKTQLRHDFFFKCVFFLARNPSFLKFFS